MAEKGVIMLVIGNGTYAQWAANMAASVRYHNPGLPIAVVADPKASSYMRAHEKEKLYDHIIEIDPEDTVSNGVFAPGKAKLSLYKYSPFDETVYLDVDGLCVRPLDGLFALCEGKDVASQVNTVSTEADETWPCQWMSLDDTKAVYGLPEKFRLPEINSSFMYWRKAETAEAYFDVAAQCFLPEYKTTWGLSFPDELAFNVAAALLELDLSIGIEKDSPITFHTKAQDVSQLPESTYVLGLYGQKQSMLHNVYRIYEKYSNKYFVSVMGTTCPYKYGQLMGNKFVLGGRPLVGKAFKLPDPVKITLPVAEIPPTGPAKPEKKAKKAKEVAQ